VTQNGIGVQAGGGGTLSVQEGTFEKNGIHAEATHGGRLVARNSVFSESINGIGAFVTNTGDGTFEGCTFSREGRAGIASDANFHITNSTVTDCSFCGVFVAGIGAGEIKGSKILSNGSCGVQVMSGSAEVTGSTIEGHTTYGIYQASGANVSQVDNVFAQNSIEEFHQE
jgi:hypothetical protein